MRGTPVRCRNLPQGCGEGSRGARRGVIAAPLPAMVDGESRAGGSGSRGLRPCRDEAAPGIAGWPERCLAFYGQRGRLSRGAAVGAVSRHPEAGVQRAQGAASTRRAWVLPR